MKCDLNCMGSDNRSYISDTIPHYFYYYDYYVILSASLAVLSDKIFAMRNCPSAVAILLLSHCCLGNATVDKLFEPTGGSHRGCFHDINGINNN